LPLSGGEILIQDNLLNAEGKIVYRSVGVHEAELLQALKELGLSK